ncbi:tetratricopeptide repeat protein [Streptomyces sp. H27-D2]|uniref:tetratricopeptide repeat protein n=1 Tax=Streptomyces sp. H27-D2 TaxID=3046304 RepID=UPI002DBAC281|nr:tetratricopeptide repeat protein [Streptomyces sp. H27-D2]MEC4019130.1 tetratricopeptide repeat protein [Streptomyces sp. H27-D2]
MTTAPSSAPPRPAAPPRRRLRDAGTVLALGAALFTAGALGLSPGEPASQAASDARPPARSTGTARDRIAALQEQLRRTPDNHPGWARLGMEYVQQVKTTADPTYYPKAEKSLRRSLSLRPADNYTAEVGMGALAAARHDFAGALRWGRRAATTNPHNAAAQGVLGDAYTQLGRYDASFRAVQRMVDLQPATPSLARASYSWELRGDTVRARELMRRALDDASDPADAAFARTNLAGLALSDGDPAAALREVEEGLRAAPALPALLEARARAHAALGRTGPAVRDYTAAIARVPQPEYVIALGELQQSLGHKAKAREQYDLYRSQERLLRAAGVALDSDATLFEADHGRPDRAVALGRAAVRSRPFLATQDAYAWALHRAGRDTEALTWSDRALALGTRSSLYRYHRGMIEYALGDRTAARADLRTALKDEPRFHPLHAATARRTLTRIGHLG